MSTLDDLAQTHLTTIELEGRRYNVTVRVTYDGVEYVGRLLFTDEAWDDEGVTDRGVLPGRTEEEVMALARRLRADELTLRFRRAVAEKRRFHELRHTTEEVLTRIRFLNQLAVSMRAGLLDVEGAAQEVDLTERQLHELVARLRAVVGVEE
jgi:hypothetical protein